MPELVCEDRERTVAILERLRAEIVSVAGDNQELLFQMRRYISRRLEFDERGTPTHRKKLKETMAKRQKGLCARCQERLPKAGAELDRFKAIDGYTVENVQLLCAGCHRKAQAERDAVGG